MPTREEIDDIIVNTILTQGGGFHELGQSKGISLTPEMIANNYKFVQEIERGTGRSMGSLSDEEKGRFFNLPSTGGSIDESGEAIFQLYQFNTLSELCFYKLVPCVTSAWQQFELWNPDSTLDSLLAKRFEFLDLSIEEQNILLDQQRLDDIAAAERLSRLRNPNIDILPGDIVIPEEEIEELSSADIRRIEQIKTDANTLIGTLRQQLSNAEGILIRIPLENDTIERELLEERAENILNDSVPLTINQLNDILGQFSLLGVNIPDDLLNLFNQQKSRHRELLTKMSGVIDIQIVPEIPIVSIFPPPVLPDVETPVITQQIPTGALLLLAPLLFLEPKMDCNCQEGFKPIAFDEFDERTGVPEEEFPNTTFREFDKTRFNEDEETGNQKDLAASMITGAFGGMLFGEPFLIRVVFSNGRTEEFIVSEADLKFFQSNLGPDDSLIILEDKGIQDLETRVTTNERNLVIAGKDLTDLGLIDVRQDNTIDEFKNTFFNFKAITDQHFIDAGLKNIQQDQSIRDAAGASGTDPLGGLGGILGGFGIGSVVVLAIVAFALFKGKIF